MTSRYLAVPFLLLLNLSACTKTGEKAEVPAVSSDNEILIGEFGSLTGSEASFGISTDEGVRLAVEEINGAGGVKGKKLKIDVVDDQGKQEETQSAVTKLVTHDKVVALIGEVASSRSLIAAPIAQEFKVPMISPASTNPKVTEKGDYIFRVCFIDSFQGTVMAKFAYQNLKVKKVAILRDVKSDYSDGLSKYFKETFVKLGGKIVDEETYISQSDIDFKAQLTAIKSNKPEAIFIPGYYTEVGLIARQARELGLKIPLLGGDGWDSPKLSEIGKEAVDGSFLSDHYTTDSTEPRVQKFISMYKAKYKTVPDAMAALAYDATKVLADAMERAKSLGGDDIRQAIAETKDFPGVTGKITIDRQRNPEKSAVVVKVSGNSFKYVTTVNP